MAMLISRASGNFTSASTWGVADSATGSQLTNPSATTTTTTSYVYSSTFTGTNGKVVDGVVLFMRRVNTTGTFSVTLSDNNGVTATREVTVNASDLPISESWIFFKFASTLTLDGGTDYRVGIKSDTAGNATVYRDAVAGNWARLISTTDTAAPAVGDTMLVVGEFTGPGTSNIFTVTMNNTANTDFGTGATTATPAQGNPSVFSGIQIGDNGVMSWDTAAATNYYLKLSGNLVVWDGGTYNMGTVATPCPRDSTMYLQFDCGVNGDFGLVVMDRGTCNLQGQSRTSGKDVVFCLLTASASAGATTLSVDRDTGWLDNDQIAVTSTTRTITQSEAGTLNGAAGTSTLTVDGFAGAGGGLQFAHDGVAPFQAEVMLLTRNVRISGASASLNAYVLLNFVPTCDFDWAEFFWIGTSTQARRGIEYGNSGPTSGNVSIQFCSIRNSGRCFFILGGGLNSGNCTFSDNTCWSSTHGINLNAAGGGTLICNNNVVSLVTTDPCITAGGGASRYEYNIVSSSQSAGFAFTSFGAFSAPVSFIGNKVHSCAGGGFNMAFARGASVTCEDLYAWRCSTAGISGPVGVADLTVSNSTIIGCTSGLSIVPVSTGPQIFLNNVNMNTESSFTMTTGINYVNSSATPTTGMNIFTSNCVINSTTGDIAVGQGRNNFLILQNTRLSGPTEVSSQSSLGSSSYIKSSNHDQTDGSFRSWFTSGRIDRDTTIFNTAAPSERLTPISSSLKLQSGSRIVAVDASSTVTIGAYVRKSASGDGAAYNGNQPRLIVKRNVACGIANDTVIATMTVATGSWEQLTGTTATVTQDGALEFYVDCDGTTGWVNVDDWSVS